MSDSFRLADEWYRWVEDPRLNENITHLLYLDWKFGETHPNHPITWCQEFDGGRSFFTVMGHNFYTFEHKNFREFIKGAVL